MARVKLTLEDSVRGIPKRSSDKKMNEEAQAYNRAMRDVTFHVEKTQLEKDRLKLTQERMMNENTRSEIEKLIGDLKGAMGASAAMDSMSALPGVGSPANALPGVGAPGVDPNLGMLPGVGAPQGMPPEMQGMPPEMQGGPLPAEMQQGGMPPNMPQGMPPMPMQG